MEWRWVVGFEGRYKVNAFGEVWKEPHSIMSKTGPRFYGARALSRSKDKDGYHLVTLDRKSYRLAALILEAFVGPRPPGHEVRHKDGKEWNDSLDNLAWGTKLENASDKHTHGTMARGEKHGKSKITEDQARAIKAATGSQAAIAKQFGVTQVTVSDIKRERTWGWL